MEMTITVFLTLIIGTILKWILLKFTGKKKMNEVILFPKYKGFGSWVLVIIIAVAVIALYLGISFALFGPHGLISPHNF